MSKDTPAEEVNKAEDFDNDEKTIRADLRVWVYSPDKMSQGEIASAIYKAVYSINQRTSTVISPSPPDAGKEQEAVEDILRWYQSKGDEYRNNTLLTDCAKDYTLYKQNK